MMKFIAIKLSASIVVILLLTLYFILKTEDDVNNNIALKISRELLSQSNSNIKSVSIGNSINYSMPSSKTTIESNMIITTTTSTTRPHIQGYYLINFI